MILRVRTPLYKFFLNPVNVTARSLRSLRNNYFFNLHRISSSYQELRGIQLFQLCSFHKELPSPAGIVLKTANLF